MPYVWKFDRSRCTGCRSCSVACVMENNLSRDLFYRWVIDTQLRSIPAAPAEQPLRFVSTACYHCADPACIAACAVTGRVGAVADELGLMGAARDDFVDAFNQTRPRRQVRKFGDAGGLLPDVLMFDPGVPDGFPNGRRLEDVVAGGGPSDFPFLDDFPFLAEPNR